MSGTEYEWNDEDTAIPAQGETAIYRNEKGYTVIRQRDPFVGEEQFVVVLPDFLPLIINRLQQYYAENRRGEGQE